MTQSKIDQKNADYDKATGILIAYCDTIPALGNTTPQDLIDQIGYLKELEKDTEKTTNILWGRLSSLQGGGHPVDSKGTPVPDPVLGEKFEYTMKPSDRIAIDQGAVKAYMDSPHVCDACGVSYQVPNFYTSTTSRTKTVKRR